MNVKNWKELIFTVGATSDLVVCIYVLLTTNDLYHAIELYCQHLCLYALRGLTAPNVIEAKLLFHGIIGIRFLVWQTYKYTYTGTVSTQYHDTTTYWYTSHPYMHLCVLPLDYLLCVAPENG